MNSNTDKPTFGQAIAMLALFLAFQTLICTPIMAITMLVRHTFTVDTTFLAIANSLAMVPTIWLGSLISRCRWRQLVVFGPIPWRLVPAVGVMAMGGFVLCSEVENLTRMVLPMPEAIVEFANMLFDVGRNPIGSILALVVVAPLTEELVCRGWVLGSLLPKCSPRNAILLSGVIFGLMHMNPWQFFYASVLGFSLGWIYWRTRSVWLCVFLHAFNNGTSWLLAYFRPVIPGLTDGPGHPARFQEWWLDLTAAAVFLLGVWLLQKGTPTPPPVVANPEPPPVIPQAPPFAVPIPEAPPVLPEA